MPDLDYRIFRNRQGLVDAINRTSDGVTVPIWDESDPLTIELRQWELENGALDLSDHFVELAIVIEQQNYFGFYSGLLSEAINLFMFVRDACNSSLLVSNCYGDLKDAIQFQQLPGFQASISNLFAAMKATDHEFSPAQTAQMRVLLNANGFSSIVFPLGE